MEPLKRPFRRCYLCVKIFCAICLSKDFLNTCGEFLWTECKDPRAKNCYAKSSHDFCTTFCLKTSHIYLHVPVLVKHEGQR